MLNVEITKEHIRLTVRDLRSLRRIDAGLYFDPTRNEWHLISLRTSNKMLEDDKPMPEYVGDIEMLESVALGLTFKQWVKEGPRERVTALADDHELVISLAQVADWKARMDMRVLYRKARKSGGKDAVYNLYRDWAARHAFTWYYEEYLRADNLSSEEARYQAAIAQIEASTELPTMLKHAWRLDVEAAHASYFADRDEPLKDLLSEIYGEEDEA